MDNIAKEWAKEADEVADEETDDDAERQPNKLFKIYQDGSRRDTIPYKTTLDEIILEVKIL